MKKLITQKQFDNWLVKGFEGLIQIFKDSFIIKDEHTEQLKLILHYLGILTIPSTNPQTKENVQELILQSLITLTKLLNFRPTIPLDSDCVQRIAHCRQTLINELLFKDN